MDNPSQESNTGPLNETQAASVLAALLDPPKADESSDAQAPAAEVEAQPPTEAESAPNDDPLVTVKVDGKEIEVPLSELKNGYQRQADYTQKTMAVAEQRKAAEAEAAKAKQARDDFIAKASSAEAKLEALIQEQQSSIDWENLLQNDPVEYLKQQHRFQQRQAELFQVRQHREQAQAQAQAEAQQAQALTLQQQQELLLAKLPDWKDAQKAKAEQQAIRDFLRNEGFEDAAINNITDARAVLLARKAMLYDQMLSKAQAAAKKVSTLPQKVERPGGGETQSIDRRTQAYQRLSKSGSVDDAAALFASIL